MSKEIAQTVGTKRMAWLIALIAAFAVFATLGSQWRSSEAALPTAAVTLSGGGSATPGGAQVYIATFTFNPSGSVPAGGAGTFSVNFDDSLTFVGVTSTTNTNSGIIAIDAVNCSNSGATNVVTCTDDTGDFWTDGNLIFTFTNPFVDTTIGVPTACTLTDVTSVNCSVTATGATVANPITVSPPTATNALGVAETYTFTFPGAQPGYTCASDSNANGITPECTAADVILTGGLTLLSGPTKVGQTILVTVINSTAAPTTGTVALAVKTLDVPNPAAAFTSDAGTKIYTAGELRHVTERGELIVDEAGKPLQELNNNVRGSSHTVCVVDTSSDAGAALLIPQLNAQPSDFINQPANAYSGLETVVPQTPTASNISVFTGDGAGNGGLNGATCVSWYSTGAGDQQLSLDYVGADGATYTIDWDTNDNGNGQGTSPANDSIIKEWNVLEDSTVTWSGVKTGSSTHDGGAGASIVIPLYLNPSTGGYNWTGGSTLTVHDTFNGSHLNSGAQLESVKGLVGVNWTISSTSTCGSISKHPTSGTTQQSAVDLTDPELGESSQTYEPHLVITDIGDCVLGDSIVITFTGSEGPLASGTGLTVTEKVTITFTIPPPAQKQVFLAWAGQRIILEHDWRIPPGDFDGTDPDEVDHNGSCPFDGSFSVSYIKGSGPGNFLPSLGASINGSDQATVRVADGNHQDDEDIPGAPQDSCISRVLFESEDQGQVDIEAFVDNEFRTDFLRAEESQQAYGGNVTKHAFVIYYMKINTIGISLVTQVSKPDHNGTSNANFVAGGAMTSTGTAGDYSPGNPWDASKDDADNATDWNVSKDLLVRGRVTGWFTTTNPSGRAADTSNPLNVLPANRWVMPNDWPLLAGGPDGEEVLGTAEAFRPYFDIMFAPNNARGIALGNPAGTNLVAVTTVATGNTGTGTSTAPVKVASCADLVPGAVLVFGASTTTSTVTSCTGTSLVLTVARTSAPAAATIIYIVSGAPFEGPYSLLDIPGLASQFLGGAALSNIDVDNIRDTILDDGDVDWWDAPMPPAMVSVGIRGTGFIKQVLKYDVYYNGTANADITGQNYPNAFYHSNIPDSPFIPAIVVGGGYFWNSWGNDGPGGNGQGVYTFWQPALVGTNSAGFGDTTVTSAQAAELAKIVAAYGDASIARDLVIYSDNHGEFMVTANGDFKTDLTACASSPLGGSTSKHCKTGDKVGTGTITATVDYPDFRGKHFPVLSNAATVTWLWGGYKDVTVEPGETDQFKYVVFHGMDRDGFCLAPAGAVSLHSILASVTTRFDDNDATFNHTGNPYFGDPVENVDFLIDSGEGIILAASDGRNTGDVKQFATGVPTYSIAYEAAIASGKKVFPLSSLAATGQTDECQAWIKVSNSLLGILNVLAIAHDDEGDIGFDKIIDLTNTTSYTLNFRWSLVTWAGANNIAVADALKGTGTSGNNPGGNDISASVTAIYGWDQAAQQWLGYFPSGVNVPGANDLTALKDGSAYWIAITGPGSVTWTIASNVD